VEVITALLAAGADKTIEDWLDSYCWHIVGKTPYFRAKNQQCKNALYPLHVASKDGHVEVVKSLFQAGGDVNEKDEEDGSTPLHLASKNGHVEVITALLAIGADKTIQNRYGKTAHSYARNRKCRNALRK